MAKCMTCPPYLLPLLSLFSAHGECAYPVGGCVRDSLLGAIPHDWDVAVTTSPERTVALCEAAGYRTVPTGLKHGTVTILLPRSGDPHDRTGAYDPVECTTCRTEGGYSDGRHPDAVAFTGRIEDDLSRRDFTINAMAFAPTEGSLEVLDLFGGQEDLAAGTVRCVGDPDTRFSEDALRMLRAVRFAVKLGFAIHPDTADAIRRQRDGLIHISRERIGDEFYKILESPHSDQGVALLRELGLLAYVLPGGASAAIIRRVSVTSEVDYLGVLPAAFVPRMAALQWGLDRTAIEENLAGLRLPTLTRKAVLAITDTLSSPPIAATPYAARKWRHDHSDLAIAALLVRRLHAAMAAKAGQPPLDPPVDLDTFITLVQKSEACGDPVRLSDLALNGRDLIALGFAPGPGLQEILNHLLDTVWTSPACNTPESLTAEALRHRP